MKARALEMPVWLPLSGCEGESITLSLSTGDSLKLIANSVVFPLAGFIAGAMGAQLLNFGEPLVVLGSLLGLGGGMLICKTQSLDRFQVYRG